MCGFMVRWCTVSPTGHIQHLAEQPIPELSAREHARGSLQMACTHWWGQHIRYHVTNTPNAWNVKNEKYASYH
jgi:hypothetical protein